MALKKILTQARLKELLNYNPLTGIFTRRIGRQGTQAGATTGCPDTGGHMRISVDGKMYGAHHLAWLYVHGRFPPYQIDHIDHNRANNKISNLREATHTENVRNATRRKDNTSGHTGVVWHKKLKKWHAKISVDKLDIHLGVFSNFAKAVAARKSAELKYGFHPNHGKGVA